MAILPRKWAYLASRTSIWPGPPSRNWPFHVSSLAVGWPKVAPCEGISRTRPKNRYFPRFLRFRHHLASLACFPGKSGPGLPSESGLSARRRLRLGCPKRLIVRGCQVGPKNRYFTHFLLLRLAAGVSRAWQKHSEGFGNALPLSTGFPHKKLARAFPSKWLFHASSLRDEAQKLLFPACFTAKMAWRMANLP